MATWEVIATDYDEARTPWLEVVVDAPSIDAAYKAAEQIAEHRDQGSRFRGCDFLWRVTAKQIESGTKALTFPFTHSGLYDTRLVPTAATQYQAQRSLV